MRRSRISIALGLAAVMGLGLMAGCETIGRHNRRPESEFGAVPPDAGAPEGSHRETGDARPRGAWSSEAASVEKNLTRRTVDPNW